MAVLLLVLTWMFVLVPWCRVELLSEGMESGLCSGGSVARFTRVFSGYFEGLSFWEFPAMLAVLLQVVATGVLYFIGNEV